MAAERVKMAITETLSAERPMKVILDAYNATGSASYVSFTMSKEPRSQTDPRRCHVAWVVCDSGWEAEFRKAMDPMTRLRAE